MHKYSTRSFLSTVFVLALASSGSADTISPETPNARFAAVEILDSYPGCDRPGQVAFRTSFEIDELTYYFTKDGQPLSSRLDAEQESSQRICTRISRRGTTVERFVVSCEGNSLREDPFSSMLPDELDVSLSGSFLTCQSPTSHHILESDWEASVVQFGKQTLHQGHLLIPSREGCAADIPIDETVAIIRHAIAGVTQVRDLWRMGYRSYSSASEPSETPTFFQIELRELPILGATGQPSENTLNSVARFFPKFDGQSQCYNGICALPKVRLSNIRAGLVCNQ